jgi:uncharacterized protein (TIGR02147 family)
MKEQLAIQNLLRAKLTEIQKTNPQYSLRAYSKKVGVHVGALSSILNGKRNVSRELAERITTKLMLDPQERSEILCHFPEKRRYQKSDLTNAFPDPRYLEFNASQFKVVAEWEHFAVMSLLNCEGFQGKVSWISGRLGITETRATQVIQRLLELGLFSLNENGEITRSKQSYRTSDDVADLSLKKCHDETLELAKESLHRDPVEVRDFTSITMAIDPRKLSMAKERIRKFQDELSDLLEEGTRTEVYRLSMQVFPLSKLKVGELK